MDTLKRWPRRNGVGGRHGSKKPLAGVQCNPSAIEAGVLIKPEEDLFDPTLAAGSMQIPEKWAWQYWTLEVMVYPVSSTHNMDFQDGLVEHELKLRDSIWEAVSFLLEAQLYKIRCNWADDN